MQREDQAISHEMTLTNQQKQELKVLHGATRDGRVRDRIKVVIHASNGWSTQEIADALLIHESTVGQHLNDYLQLNKLKPENGGSQSYLSTTQAQALVEHLTEKTYHHTHQIVAYVRTSFALNTAFQV